MYILKLCKIKIDCRLLKLKMETSFSEQISQQSPTFQSCDGRKMQGRYIFTLLACLGNMMNLLGRDSLRLAILPMQTEFNMTVSEVSHVLGGYNYGMMFTMLAGGPLSDILGGKWLLLLVTLLSGLCTALIPLLANISVTVLVVSQVVYGLAGGLVVPALGSMIARWEPLSERGRLATVIYTGSQLSAVFSSLFTGYVCYHQDWRITFYILGGLPLTWAVPWLWLVTDNPDLSSLTGQAEREMLAAEIPTSTVRPSLKDIPVRRMMSSGPVLAMMVANVGCTWAGTHTSLLLPQYLHYLQLPLHYTSLVSAIPYIGSCLIGLLSSLVYTRIVRSGLSQTAARKICSSVCLFGFAALTLPVPFIQNNTVMVTVLTTSAYAMMGFNLVGAWSNPLDIAPNFVGTMMGVTGMFCYLTGALVPHTTAIMASLVEEDMVWPGLFILVCVVATVANIIFLLYGTANLQPWNALTQSREKLNTEGDFLHNNLIIDFHKQHKKCDHDLI